jgi:hypothetical protein
VNQETRSEWNDDFFLDGSKFSAEDLDYASIPFLGGALDGNVMTFGIHIVPDQITARFARPGSHEYEQQDYALAFSSCDPTFWLVPSGGN